MHPWNNNSKGGPNPYKANKDEMTDNQKQQICDGSTNHIAAVPQGSAIQRKKTDMLEDNITKFENHTQ